MADAPRIEAEVAVVGAGAAGLYAALTAARSGARVALISATPLAQTASYWAQGGIAAALAVDDSPDLHREDTERAGRGLVRPSAAAVLCREAPRTVAELERLGVRFDADRAGNLALGLEGGHSRRRVVHAGGSATGRRVVRELSALVVEHQEVTVVEGARATRLWTAAGLLVRPNLPIVPLVLLVHVVLSSRSLPRRSADLSTEARSAKAEGANAGWIHAGLFLVAVAPARAPRCSTALASGSWRSWRRATRSRERSGT